LLVFVTGATGFVGRALTQRLFGAGHQVIALARNPQRAHNQLGPLAGLLNALAIRATLRAIFGYRKNAVERLFGVGAQDAIPGQAPAE
jgi:nucleoside-diphosphate-sugar epimerase